jgi:calcineurin-like phosphoesterase family protein
MIYLTSDLHLGHFNIIKYCKRPFATCSEMDNAIIENINEVVGENDVLYCLGDFAIRKESVSQYRKRINCKNVHLILGNHDHANYCWSNFTSVNTYQEIRRDGKIIIMCHYPFAAWNKKRYGSFCLHGHCHGTYVPGLPKETSNGLCLDVGVDVHSFSPISLMEVIDIMNEKEELISGVTV